MFRRTESLHTFIRLYPAVTIISCIHVVLWIMMKLSFPIFTLLFSFLTGYNAGVHSGEWWRLITPIFLHTSFSHLLFNTITLIIFAPPLERMVKSIYFLVIYSASGIIANIATYLIMPMDYSHAGASGAIFGILGTYMFICFFRKEYMDQKNSQMILTVTAIALVLSFIDAHVNVVAHVTGLLAGFLLGKVFVRKKPSFIHYTYYHQPVRQEGMKLFFKKWSIWIFVFVFILAAILYVL
ncbi:MAG: rhomboid family intramembrane serine protease [Bacillaceae bacterium]|jgi:rhomboid protease GluP|nr:MAG: rhomboid family intramembrane serine protease [Bacillaceae bacterium]